MKKRIKSIYQLKKEAQKAFNSFIRNRDSKDNKFKCISCANIFNIKHMNAGHYFPVKGYNWLRFNETNCNGECQHCNAFNDAHLIRYTWNLINKVGQEEYDNLYAQSINNQKEFTRDELKEIIEKYSKYL
jgi:hypothetical protein